MRIRYALVLCVLATLSPVSLLAAQPAQEKGKVRLFILSGQSNMARLNPDASFTPALKKAFPQDEVIVVKSAQGGQPIQRWYKGWKAPADVKVKPAKGQSGDLYDLLMDKVRSAIKGKTIDTVAFIWMQGESDAQRGPAGVYEASLRGLIKQLRDDLKRPDLVVVIGRLNDYKSGQAGWDTVRSAQEKVASEDPLGRWVDTDKLDGKKDLHHTVKGYEVMGRRFAAAAVELLAKKDRKDSGDTAIFKKMLAIAEAWANTSYPKKSIDPATQRQFTELAGQVADPALRGQAQKLAAELEPVCVQQARSRFLLGEVKRLKGNAVTEPGGPAWLAKLVGPEPMTVFTRLTEIELNEHTDGHADKKPRPKSDAVSDAWLKNVEGLPDLIRLELSGTSISDAALVSVGTLRNLERLNVCLTPVTDAGLKHLAGLTRLKRLVICSTKVTGSGFKDISDWPVIESINLHSCPTSDDGLAAISRFANLQRLEIVHSKVTDAGLKHVGKLTNLRQLHVASHGLTRSGLGFVENLSKLYQLDLYEELASNEALVHAGKLTNLKILNLYSGPADDAGLAALRNLHNLDELTISGLGKVTDAAVDHLAGLKNLKQLKISGTKMSAAGMQRLNTLLPAAKISK